MLKLISKSSTLPVSLSDVKQHLAMDGTTEDARITSLIWAADSLLQQQTSRAFVSQVWTYSLCSFGQRIELVKPPLVTVDSVKYYDADNVLQTVSTSAYLVHIVESDYSYLMFNSDYSFPSLYARDDSVQITFTCGDYLPDTYLHCIRLIVSSWNENREGENKIPEGITHLVNSLKTGRYN